MSRPQKNTTRSKKRPERAAKVGKSTDRRRAIGRPSASAQAVGRAALIEATCDLLSRLPRNQVTRAQVARTMNVDPSLIRYYFRNRSTLLLAAVERLSGRFLELVEEATDHTDQSPQGRMRARVSSLLQVEASYPFFHRLIVDEVAQMQTAASQKLLKDLMDRGIKEYHAIIEAGAREGVLRPVDTLFLFMSIIGMCQFFISGEPILKLALGRNYNRKTAVDRYGEFITDLLLRGLETKPSAPAPARS